jgi:Molybdopterin-binding domain of aldehyde dehydrogenase
MRLHDALLACRRGNVPIEALGTFFGPKGKPLVKSLQADRVFPDFTFGTHLCDLEVDLDTGQVKLLGYVAAHDVGRAINPRSVQGQITGAVAQGLGMALLEEVVVAEGPWAGATSATSAPTRLISVSPRRIRGSSRLFSLWAGPASGMPGGLSGPGRGAVAAQDLGPVLVPGGGGAVGMQQDGPAPPVDHDLMVE